MEPSFFFFFNCFEFISVNSRKMANMGELPYGVLGTAPKFGSAKKLNLSLCLRPPNNVAKGNFLRLCSYKLIVKKSALDVQNLLVFFLLLIGLIAVAVTVAFVVAPRIYRLV